ncbi:hypothetical protein [Salinivibrio kushneri]|uniref:hypothetical protein n=1 Tax=Salinivibrio kushneri TaxID=1908198 RepID=UPI000985F6B5|nr:hypothetical protein [Salinivibrio kushneri]OOE51786.1 hypothetical protein BZG11_06030 [Salinivibrio kushneri]OOE54380.1 hypothetical protein BZG10_04370 [Salinivibrio kushneri]OOE62085.1 hypothetical protein BZG18_06100 [Salinivibrio kushneri]
MKKTNIPYGPSQRPWYEQVPDFAKDYVSAPTHDPLAVYQQRNQSFVLQQTSLCSQDFEIPPHGLSDAEQYQAMRTFYVYSAQQADRFLGYQVESRFTQAGPSLRDYAPVQSDLEQGNWRQVDYPSRIAPFLTMSLNNVGDPFVDGDFTLNSKNIERMVLDYYACLWRAQWPSLGYQPHNEHVTPAQQNESYWGYVLTMGSTEGNLYAMLNARDYLSGRMLLRDQLAEQAQCAQKNSRIDEQSEYFSVYPDTGEAKYHPVAFFSEDTHYSIVKAMEVEKIDTFATLGRRLYPEQNPLNQGEPWPDAVPSQGPTEALPVGSGAVDIDSLITLVRFFAQKGHPILVVLNFGTTFKGAYDDVPKALAELEQVLKEAGLYERKVTVKTDTGKTHEEMRSGYWIHIDGALGANYAPFIQMASPHDMPLPNNLGKNIPKEDIAAMPAFDFSLPMVHSMVASGHKWPGSPWPTGVYMTKQKYMVSPPDDPEYIGSPDTTFAGSRSGLSPLILWHFFATNSYQQQREKALYAIELAYYAVEKLEEVAAYWREKSLGRPEEECPPDGLWLQHTPLSLSLIFSQPSDEIIAKYSLAKETITDPNDNNFQRQYVHLFTMWDVSEARIDALCNDLMSPNALKPLSDVKTQIDTPSRDLPKNHTHLPLKGRSFR